MALLELFVRTESRSRVAAAVLVLIGCAQMAADVVGLERLAALVDAFRASPAIRIFASDRDHETFTSRVEIRYASAGGGEKTLALTPKAYARLGGPSDRRIAYAAALAYAPVLIESAASRGMVPAVLRYGLCEPAPLIEELELVDIDRDAAVSVVIAPRESPSRENVLRFEVRCDD